MSRNSENEEHGGEVENSIRVDTIWDACHKAAIPALIHSSHTIATAAGPDVAYMSEFPARLSCALCSHVLQQSMNSWRSPWPLGLAWYREYTHTRECKCYL